MRSRPATPSSCRGLVALLICVGVIAASAAICQVWTRLRVIDYGYKISRATRTRTELTEANRRLRLEVALLTNPARIAQRASQELGLAPPSPDQVRRLRRRAAGKPVSSPTLAVRAGR